jgi:hypothetical protein
MGQNISGSFIRKQVLLPNQDRPPSSAVSATSPSATLQQDHQSEQRQYPHAISPQPAHVLLLPA